MRRSAVLQRVRIERCLSWTAELGAFFNRPRYSDGCYGMVMRWMY